MINANIWTDLIVPGVPVLEKILRPVIVYIFLLIGMRIAGKREIAQLSPPDLIVLLMLSNTVQNAIIGDDTSVTGGLIGATTLLAANWLVARFLYSHKKLGDLVEGDAVVLIKDGKLRPDKLKKELVTSDELEAAARGKGFMSLDEVDYAVLESGGTISCIGKKPSENGALMVKLDQIAMELAELKRGLKPSR